MVIVGRKKVIASECSDFIIWEKWRAVFLLQVALVHFLAGELIEITPAINSPCIGRWPHVSSPELEAF